MRTKLPEAAVHDRQLGVTAVTHGRIRSVARGSELERTAANWRGSFRFITHYAVGEKSVLSRHPLVGNLGGNFRKQIHKGMNLLKLLLEFDASPGHQ